jgi:tRNA 2-thiouridine synthesizing protein A
METLLDARGLACPLPAVKARGALDAVPPGATLVVLATDPEAPIDVAAVALDAGCTFVAERDGPGWRLTLRRPTCATGTRSGPRAPGRASAP